MTSISDKSELHPTIPFPVGSRSGGLKEPEIPLDSKIVTFVKNCYQLTILTQFLFYCDNVCPFAQPKPPNVTVSRPSVSPTPMYPEAKSSV